MDTSTTENNLSLSEARRHVVELEAERSQIAAAIRSAINDGDALEADRLLARESRLPMLLEIARVAVTKIELAELRAFADALDGQLPALSAERGRLLEEASTMRREMIEKIGEADHLAAVALDRLRAVEEQRNKARAEISTLENRLRHGVGGLPIASSSAKAGVVESCARPVAEYHVASDVGQVG